MLDSNLTMGLHTKSLSESCFHHVCFFRQIRSSLGDAMAASVASDGTCFVVLGSDELRSISYYMVLHWNIQRVQHALQASRSWWISALALHSLLMHSSDSFTGFRLNEAYSSNSSPLVAFTTSYWPYNIISPLSLYAHPLLISYLFRDIAYHLDLVLSASEPHGSGTPCLSAFVNL